jgi:hypothetical protein
MRAPTQRNPPQYSPECWCTQHAIVAHLSASSQLRHQTNISNALILSTHDKQLVHYLRHIDSAAVGIDNRAKPVGPFSPVLSQQAIHRLRVESGDPIAQ